MSFEYRADPMNRLRAIGNAEPSEADPGTSLCSSEDFI